MDGSAVLLGLVEAMENGQEEADSPNADAKTVNPAFSI